MCSAWAVVSPRSGGGRHAGGVRRGRLHSLGGRVADHEHHDRHQREEQNAEERVARAPADAADEHRRERGEEDAADVRAHRRQPHGAAARPLEPGAYELADGDHHQPRQPRELQQRERVELPDLGHPRPEQLAHGQRQQREHHHRPRARSIDAPADQGGDQPRHREGRERAVDGGAAPAEVVLQLRHEDAEGVLGHANREHEAQEEHRADQPAVVEPGPHPSDRRYPPLARAARIRPARVLSWRWWSAARRRARPVECRMRRRDRASTVAPPPACTVEAGARAPAPGPAACERRARGEHHPQAARSGRRRRPRDRRARPPAAHARRAARRGRPARGAATRAGHRRGRPRRDPAPRGARARRLAARRRELPPPPSRSRPPTARPRSAASWATWACARC